MFESFLPELIINQPSFYSYVHLYPYILVVKISITNLLTIKWLVIIIKEPGCRRQPPLRWKVDCRHRQKNCWVWKWDYHSLFFTGLSSCFPLNCNFLGIPWYGKKNISRLIVHHSLLEEWTIVLRPWSWFHRKNVASWFSMSQKVKTSLYVVPHWAKSLSWCVHNSNFTNWFMLDILTYLLGVINQRSHNWGTTLWTWSKVS